MVITTTKSGGAQGGRPAKGECGIKRAPPTRSARRRRGPSGEGGSRPRPSKPSEQVPPAAAARGRRAQRPPMPAPTEASRLSLRAALRSRPSAACFSRSTVSICAICCRTCLNSYALGAPLLSAWSCGRRGRRGGGGRWRASLCCARAAAAAAAAGAHAAPAAPAPAPRAAGPGRQWQRDRGHPKGVQGRPRAEWAAPPPAAATHTAPGARRPRLHPRPPANAAPAASRG